MHIRIIIIVIILFTACYCENKQIKQQYYRFGKQITPSGKYVIYDYARFGTMAWSSDILGTELFRIDEKFREGQGIRLGGTISEWLSNDTLLVYNFDSELKQPKDTLPIKTDFKEIGDFIVKIVYYKANSWTTVCRNFDSVTTTNDSIFVKTVFENGEIEVLRFPLGATTIKSISDSITHITIHTRLRKKMNFSLKNPDGTFTEGLTSVGTIGYDLKPKKRISAEGFTERKIFWDIEK